MKARPMTASLCQMRGRSRTRTDRPTIAKGSRTRLRRCSTVLTLILEWVRAVVVTLGRRFADASADRAGDSRHSAEIPPGGTDESRAGGSPCRSDRPAERAPDSVDQVTREGTRRPRAMAGLPTQPGHHVHDRHAELFGVPGRATASGSRACRACTPWPSDRRSEEHTSELQSRPHLVCRLLLEKKKNILKPDHAREPDITHTDVLE